MPEDWDTYGDRLAARALARGDATSWFEELYRAGADGVVTMPWARRHAHWALVQWVEARRLVGAGRAAVVVGSGLGADAEFLAGLGFRTTGFDISATAVQTARERHRDSLVDYVQADLLDLPAEWRRAFDLVAEVITAQALPAQVRDRAIRNVSELVSPGGTLLVVAARASGAEVLAGPPWPLRRDEIEAFADGGLEIVEIEELHDPDDPGELRWRAELRRPGEPD